MPYEEWRRRSGQGTTGGLMHDITRLLSASEQGDAQAMQDLLPLLYDKLHRLAAELMAREHPGQILQATALVNEAYLRLVEPTQTQHWNGRGHFFQRLKTRLDHPFSHSQPTLLHSLASS